MKPEDRDKYLPSPNTLLGRDADGKAKSTLTPRQRKARATKALKSFQESHPDLDWAAYEANQRTSRSNANGTRTRKR